MAEKVTVRIAVSVDPTGDWYAAGWKGARSDDMRSCTLDTLESGERHYWITAELEVPAIDTIHGTAEETAND